MDEQGIAVKTRFGIRVYKNYFPILGGSFQLVDVSEKKFPALNLDFGKWTFIFGWCVIPLEGDEGFNLI